MECLGGRGGGGRGEGLQLNAILLVHFSLAPLAPMVVPGSQATVVQNPDNCIHWISHYLVQPTYPV